MPECGSTKVRFDLWAVLGFLVLLAAICIGYLFNAQAMDRERNQAVCDRVTLLEANYGHIIAGIAKIERGQEKLAEALYQHEQSTRRSLKGAY